jgi:hypothetical protein
MANLANQRGVRTIMSFFGPIAASRVLEDCGKAQIVTATNVFAHIEGIHDIVDNVLAMLSEDGVFITESHYLMALIETLQYDTIYHEHLRHYSLESIGYLLKMHGLDVIHAKRIPTHGGSVRVYAARHGARKVNPSVQQLEAEERGGGPLSDRLTAFRRDVARSKVALHALIRDLLAKSARIYGVGAPSRASTLINYVGLDREILDCVVEVKGSYKVGKYMPGTLVPVVDESRLFEDQPEIALLLSWHIADELMPKLRSQGFKGRFLVPLPVPRLV